jgi:hypothetical protein
MAVSYRYPQPTRVVSVPDADVPFADAVAVVMAERPWIDRPAQLEDALRPYFEDVQVRRTARRGSDSSTWYVYRGRP